MDKKIKKLQKDTKKVMKEESSLLREDKKHDKLIDKAKKKMKGRCERMPCTISIRIKDEEKSLKKDYLIYEEVTVDQDDPVIKKCIEELLQEFNAEPSDIFVSIKLQIV